MILPTLRITAALVSVAALSACGGAMRAPVPAVVPAPAPAEAPLSVLAGTILRADSASIARARTDSIRLPYTAADIHFMSGMIGHHAQAIAMSQLAPTRSATPAVQRLAERIINAQYDEINIMRQWLADRQQPIPEVTPKGMKMMMDGAEHEMLMPGMLTEQQMAQLDSARGKEFDELFLTYMIQHHRGAVGMVKELFGTYAAGQDELVFRFATDVNVDQNTEISRMEQMLFSVKLERNFPK